MISSSLTAPARDAGDQGFEPAIRIGIEQRDQPLGIGACQVPEIGRAIGKPFEQRAHLGDMPPEPASAPHRRASGDLGEPSVEPLRAASGPDRLGAVATRSASVAGATSGPGKSMRME